MQRPPKRKAATFSFMSILCIRWRALLLSPCCYRKDMKKRERRIFERYKAPFTTMIRQFEAFNIHKNPRVGFAKVNQPVRNGISIRSGSCLSKLCVPRGLRWWLTILNFFLLKRTAHDFLVASQVREGGNKPARNKTSTPLPFPTYPHKKELLWKPKQSIISYLSMTKFPSLLRIPAHMSHSSLSEGRV